MSDNEINRVMKCLEDARRSVKQTASNYFGNAWVGASIDRVGRHTVVRLGGPFVHATFTQYRSVS